MHSVRPLGFTVMLPGKYLAGGLQPGCIANLVGVQYKLRFQEEAVSRGG